MSRPVILCVDDERIILSSLKAQLQNNFSSSCIIEIAESGEEALEIIDELIKQEIELPIVIADQIMPSMKGDELLVRIKSLLPNTRTIMLTGQASADAVGKAVNKAGLFRYLSKPWDEDDLTLTIKGALDSYSHQKHLLIQSSYQTVINKTLSLATSTLNATQQISRSLSYLLTVPCLCPPSDGAVYLSNKSHLVDLTLNRDCDHEKLVLKKVCAQHDNTLNDEYVIESSDIETYQECVFVENKADTPSYFTCPILFEDELIGLLLIYVNVDFTFTNEISSFLSSFAQSLSNIYRLSHSNFAFHQSNNELKRHKLELENLVRERTTALNDALIKQEENNAMLVAANEELAYFATTDSLTGLFNRRHFFKLAKEIFTLTISSERSCSVAMIDVDHFKTVNDKYGHQLGDELLTQVAKTLIKSIDDSAIACRFGGEEFVLLLPNTPIEKANTLCKTLLENISNTRVNQTSSTQRLSEDNHPQKTNQHSEANHISATISVGLSLIHEQDKNIEQSVNRADKALYKAKADGRNRVVIFDDDAQ